MRAKSEKLQYALLCLAVLGSLLFFAASTAAHFDELIHHGPRAREPFQAAGGYGFTRQIVPEIQDLIGAVAGHLHGAVHPPGQPGAGVAARPHRMRFDILPMPEALRAGLRPGDTILSVDNVPFTGMESLLEETFRAPPGQTVTVVYRTPRGETRTALVPLRPQISLHRGVAWWLISIVQVIAFPALCLLLGFWVVAAKPRDLNAWSLLGVMNAVPVFIGRSGYYPGFLGVFTTFWRTFSIRWTLISLILLGIYFPVRSRLDVRHPWIKWTLIIPQILIVPIAIGLRYGILYEFRAVEPYLPAMGPLGFAGNMLAAISVLVFIVAIIRKLFTVPEADARRRLGVVVAGSLLGLSPALTMLLLSTFAGRTLFELGRAYPWIFIVALFLAALFPLSLAYTVIVQRALDVRIFLRQGTRYAFARGTLWALQWAVIFFLIYRLTRFIQEPGHHLVRLLVPVVVVVLVLVVRLRVAPRLSLWLDRRFFREAYSVEQILSGLSVQARGFTETAPLLQTIGERIADALHVESLAILLRNGQSYHLAYAQGIPDAAGVVLSAQSSTIRTLERSGEPARVERERPDPWLVLAPPSEMSVLDRLRAELMLPLPGRSSLIGVMSLGPKRSEEPYSPADRRLLQSVASQTGLAIENSELIHNLAEEASHRERMNREIEIAQEVQERLFPQETPEIEGADLAGFCRAAQQVGGDYFDFIPLANGSLGIAVGDVSGKGISAALLMASIRAALRGLTLAGTLDLPGVMQRMNQIAYDSSTTNRFATFVFAEYIPEGRRVDYVNAGHNPPLLLRACPAGDTAGCRRQVERLEVGGPVMGVFPQLSYEQGRLALRSGDVLVIFTDGISEAMTAADQEWGEECLIEAARDCAHLDAQEIVASLVAAVDRFTAGAPQSDDLTLVVLKAR
jgi:sigma-B regulation protein RsbU (phosphoserine phosphatase)